MFKPLTIQKAHEEPFLGAFIGMRSWWGVKTSLWGIKERDGNIGYEKVVKWRKKVK